MSSDQCLVFVHLYDTNRLVVKAAKERGIRVVLLSTSLLLEESRSQLHACDPSGNFDKEIIYGGDLQGKNTAEVQKAYEAVKQLPWNLLQFVPGSDNSVELCFRLRNLHKGGSDTLSDGQAACLDKYLMNELIRSKGLASVQQRRCSTRAQIMEMVNSDSTCLPMVVKPIFSTASEDVFFCNSVDEACEAMEHITSKAFTITRLPQHKVALCQQLLVGIEYVVDTVSRGGNHKIVGVWRYEKRPTNGSQFVYFAMRLEPRSPGPLTQLCEYVENVLDGLDFQSGACHTEVIMSKSGPVLVEVNCRVGGFMESWVPLVTFASGYNQVEAAVDCYISSKKFDDIPEYPSLLDKFAVNVLLPSFESGTIQAIPGLEEVKKMTTLKGIIMFEQIGDTVKPTTNLLENTGFVMLAGLDKAELDTQCAEIHRLLQEKKFFDIRN